MKIVFVFLLNVLLVSSKSMFSPKFMGPAQPPSCSNLVPQKDVDWTKLVGDWHHLMYIPDASNTFITCRQMEVTDVNSTEKVLDLEFSMRSYSGYEKFVGRDSTFYRWFDAPGVIHTSIKYDTNSKAPSKMGLRKTAMTQQMRSSIASKFTVVGTDHENYIILTQCRRYGAPFVWVSLKNLTVEREVMDEIRTKLTFVGIDAAELVFNGEAMCLT